MLKLTKKADYGLIALRHLAVVARHDEVQEDSGSGLSGVLAVRGSASAKEIADSYGIPLPLLAKILQKLVKSGFLQSLAGTNGGYRLARNAKLMSTLEVIRTIDGPIFLTACFTEHHHCDQSEKCTVREPLRKVHEAIVDILAKISIADLAEGEQVAGLSSGLISFAPPPLPGAALSGASSGSSTQVPSGVSVRR